MFELFKKKLNRFPRKTILSLFFFKTPHLSVLLRFDSGNVVPPIVFFPPGSCQCWRRRCTATAPPSGARTTWQESQEARFRYTQVTHAKTAAVLQPDPVESGLSLLRLLPSHQCTPGGQASVL